MLESMRLRLRAKEIRSRLNILNKLGLRAI